MQSADFKGLPGNAVKLLMALAYQYRGSNNGNLIVAWSIMKRDFGFRSQETVTRAKNQLEAARIIVQTRTPKFFNPGGQCALYAVTWQSIDECPGRRLEVKPTIKPWRDFSPSENK
jgi:hypothetical protein